MIAECRPELLLPLAELSAVGILAFSAKLRKEVIKRQRGRCADCEEKTRLQIHHILPQCQGGEDTIENGVGLCTSCHRKADELAIRGHIYHPQVHFDNDERIK